MTKPSSDRDTISVNLEFTIRETAILRQKYKKRAPNTEGRLNLRAYMIDPTPNKGTFEDYLRRMPSQAVAGNGSIPAPVPPARVNPKLELDDAELETIVNTSLAKVLATAPIPAAPTLMPSTPVHNDGLYADWPTFISHWPKGGTVLKNKLMAAVSQSHSGFWDPQYTNDGKEALKYDVYEVINMLDEVVDLDWEDLSEKQQGWIKMLWKMSRKYDRLHAQQGGQGAISRGTVSDR